MNYKEQAEAQLCAADFNKNQLPDISGLAISGSDPMTKMLAFLQAVGNPYLFRVGDIAVHLSFSGRKGDSLQKRVCHLLSKSI